MHGSGVHRCAMFLLRRLRAMATSLWVMAVNKLGYIWIIIAYTLDSSLLKCLPSLYIMSLQICQSSSLFHTTSNKWQVPPENSCSDNAPHAIFTWMCPPTVSCGINQPHTHTHAKRKSSFLRSMYTSFPTFLIAKRHFCDSYFPL